MKQEKNNQISWLHLNKDSFLGTVRRNVLASGLLISLAILKISFLCRPYNLVATFKTFPGPMGWIWVC